ncbi:MarR family transcriptional regulator [Bacillus sp. AGMB 02131]|uniref:MarR family transcriptional regulator n=1 Tax=Peribacillus faecalis TaxID=2772559 RepID=A0A927CYZ2_9BACI|nr:MarR family transcriptional regulator [Peribacillus faecalis]MBD3109601.1 MarR family transcriptional regulator [Peribacillus faecalis]
MSTNKFPMKGRADNLNNNHTEEMGRYIAKIHCKGSSIISKELQEFGIGSGQFPSLLRLYQQDGISQEELAKQLLVDKATITRAIKKLEEENLVYRIRDEKDKRYYKVFITKKALDIKEEVFKKVHTWDEALKQCLTKEVKTTRDNGWFALRLKAFVTDQTLKGY